MANRTSRRTVLAGLGTVAAASALAACSGGSGSSTSGDGSTNTPTGGSANTPTGSSGGGAANSSLGNVSDIPVGGGKIFDAQKVVVTQPTQGQLKCFSAICTHMGCVVHDVTDGTINCACHGSRYSIKDGAVVNGPAPRPLAAEQISVSGGNITLNS
jgi:Rieske Fe-S protein